MTNQLSSRRVPWIALALSFLATGVGHIYCGRFARGIPLYFAWLLLPICVAIAMLLPASTASLVFLLMLPAITVAIVYLYAAIDSWRIASQTALDYSLRDYNRASVYWLMIVAQLLFSVGLVAGVSGFVFEAFVIPTSNMAPTILEGDRILAKTLLPEDYFPQRGDLVVYRNPSPEGGSKFIGRVIAVAGDKIQISGQRVLINGKALERDRVPDESLMHLGKQLNGQISYELNSGRRYLVALSELSGDKSAEIEFEATIPDRHVFIMGDNRSRSRDSRHFRAIHSRDIVGYVEYIFWPSESWSRFGVADDRLP